MDVVIPHASQRHALRRAVEVPCQLVTNAQFELVGQRAVDVSLSGMRICTESYLPPGEKVFVSFKAPGSQLWFDAEGEVVRTIHGQRQSDRGRQLAIRFRSLDLASRALLQARLAGFPPPVPVRPKRRDYAASVRKIFYS